ncbi:MULTISPECIES: DUF317 domain-containing protein [unclassified Kitasatospora]|uniref:DUF317 domain-containing protein n=1 Tax=unclassified Kitasatospora TaxID=2633591 RepID=UPI0033F77CCD
MNAFLHEHGWTSGIEADGGLHAASPCTRVHVGHQPDNPNADTWTIAVDGTARQPGWRARFNRHTPAELVLDLLTALVSRSTPRPDVRGRRTGDTVPRHNWLTGEGNANIVNAFLYEHGWAWVVDADGGLHTASPCTRVYVGYQPDNPNADTWTIAVDGTARQPGWRARFDRHTPAELVLDLLTALVSRSTPRPVTATSLAA